MAKTIMVTGNLGYIGSTMVPFLTDEKGARKCALKGMVRSNYLSSSLKKSRKEAKKQKESSM